MTGQVSLDELNVVELYTLWESELAQLVRAPDVALIAACEMHAEAHGVRLQDVCTLLGRATTFDAKLHPRGRDGEFIEVLGLFHIIDSLNHAINGRRGRVLDITPDPHDPNEPDIHLGLLNPDGSVSGLATVKPRNLISVNKTKGHLGEPRRRDLVTEMLPTLKMQSTPLPRHELDPNAPQTDASLPGLTPNFTAQEEHRILQQHGAENASPADKIALLEQEATRRERLANTPSTPVVGHMKVEGIDDVNKYLADHPQMPGEPIFDWQGRIVDGLTPDQKNAILFETRERYEPVDYIVAGAKQWRKKHNLPDPTIDLVTVPVPMEKADEVARAFEQTPDQADDPKVQAAFADFKRQSAEMFNWMVRDEADGGLGIHVDWTTKKDPYPSATAQAEDLRKNHHITIESRLGGAHELSMTTAEYDQFRAVHDTFGHAGVGGGFDRHGEYEAYLMHRSMYQGDGAWAMTSEYHGVNTAMWGGDPTNPGGTGKTILLPIDLVPNPIGPTGDLVTAAVNPQSPTPDQLMVLNIPQNEADALVYLAEQAKIDEMFGALHEPSLWHELPPPPTDTEPPA